MDVSIVMLEDYEVAPGVIVRAGDSIDVRQTKAEELISMGRACLRSRFDPSMLRTESQARIVAPSRNAATRTRAPEGISTATAGNTGGKREEV